MAETPAAWTEKEGALQEGRNEDARSGLQQRHELHIDIAIGTLQRLGDLLIWIGQHRENSAPIPMSSITTSDLFRLNLQLN
jgi:hypothetical protein